MTGPEHYREAERLLAISTADNPVTAAEAQVHATLALVTATVSLELGHVSHYDDSAWHEILRGRMG